MKILILFSPLFIFVKGYGQTRDVGSIQDTSRVVVYVFVLDDSKIVNHITPSNTFKAKWVKSIEVRKDHNNNISDIKSDSCLYLYKREL